MFKSLKIMLLVIMLSTGVYQVKAISILKPIITTGDNPVLETVGNLTTYAVPLAALSASLVLRDWQGAGQFLAAIAVSGATAGILKNTVQERRPWQPVGEKGVAFPSGHAVAAFAGSWFFWRRYGWRYGLFASLFALFVGYYRVEMQAHWVHDIIGSAVIAFLSAWLFVSKRTKPKLPPIIQFLFKPLSIRFNFKKDNIKW
ncbi:MAG: phosphatase PAP2 family protein [Alphaproteobacteria bacterium]|nr:phosphatase PAP2 family protein [Alphaproteobacteria bacterium]